ncbi:cupin domain-containing protein [Pseudoalteromonas sp. JBTF-M23]|uniref:Cupin domain-containing protein n=1 Tax=Pseudoalteromonas caenipelagi TaxID=2726988 RepID=A0A849VH41_9GAMM|nr:cupin domain-containing protein [Pseudoalteromonas caenipelagi]NOU51007.1 cupin domain-containing protein [Pseudoalteromonas caenipelagi]
MNNNLFSALPNDKSKEHIEDLITSKNVRIERIVSYGQTSDDAFWYDQEEHEWVMVLSGSGTVEFSNGQKYTLEQGDFLTIPAHTQHRVSHTSTEQATIWLAVFYND